MLAALSSKSVPLVNIALNTDFRMVFYNLSQLQQLMQLLIQFQESQHHALIIIQILKKIQRNENVMSDISQQITSLLLNLIKKFETDKQIIVDSVGILRVLLQRFPKFVFGTLKAFLSENQSNNTILISYAALLPQLLNVTQSESLQLANQIRMKLSEQDFLSPVTNGVLSLLDINKFQFLDSQKYFDEIHSNYIQSVTNNISATYTKPVSQNPVITPKVNLNLINLAISFTTLAENQNPEALQIIAAVATQSNQILQVFIQILQRVANTTMTNQNFEQIMEIICYFIVKNHENNIPINTEIIKIFQQLLRSETLSNCTLLTQLYISRITMVIIHNINLQQINLKFLNDIFSYLTKAVQNINNSKDLDQIYALKQTFQNENFRPSILPQIWSVQPPQVQNKLVKSFLTQICYNLSILPEIQNFDLNDLFFELKVVSNVSLYRLLTGNCLTQLTSTFAKNLLKAGTRDPQWRVRIQSFEFFRKAFPATFYTIPEHLSFPNFECKKLVSETLLLPDNGTFFQQITDSVFAVRQNAINSVQEQFARSFQSANPLQFNQILSQNIQQYIKINNSVFQPVDVILLDLQLARCLAAVSKILRYQLAQQVDISLTLSDFARDFFQCVCCVFQVIEERSGEGSGEYAGFVAQIEREGCEV